MKNLNMLKFGTDCSYSSAMTAYKGFNYANDTSWLKMTAIKVK